VAALRTSAALPRRCVMDKVVALKDGTEVLIRPMTKEDLDKSFAFFQELPEDDRKYLRVDVTRRDVVERRIRDIDAGKVKRLVAVINDQIVADGALELAGHDWTCHVGELRLIVARPFQRKGLGMLMARELYGLAASEKVEQLLVSMARPQAAARSIFRRLGFREEIILPDHVRDRSGKTHDLILMRCDLEAAWRELETFFEHSDWQRAR
jgi:L-amino acid N-acyltransferase YncA